MCAALLALTAGFAAGPVRAEGEAFDTPSGLQVPRWAMLRRNEVNARNGPSKDNRVVWVYHKASLPVQIISETRDWRLICDPQGAVAWVSRTMLQAPKTVLSPQGQKLQMRESPDEEADVKAILRPRALASLDKCKKGWCRIAVSGQTGWVPQQSLWGTQTTAACKRPDPFAGK
jgi:SH3-like domain-containing protein